jgi:hypothetical protein
MILVLHNVKLGDWSPKCPSGSIFKHAPICVSDTIVLESKVVGCCFCYQDYP